MYGIPYTMHDRNVKSERTLSKFLRIWFWSILWKCIKFHLKTSSDSKIEINLIKYFGFQYNVTYCKHPLGSDIVLTNMSLFLSKKSYYCKHILEWTAY